MTYCLPTILHRTIWPVNAAGRAPDSGTEPSCHAMAPCVSLATGSCQHVPQSGCRNLPAIYSTPGASALPYNRRMYIIAIGWMWVVLMMAITEPNIVAAILSLVFYGVLPCSLLLWLMGTPARRRRRAREQAAGTESPGKDEA